MSLKRAPVVVNLREKDILKSDLLQELRIDHHKLDRSLLEQPGIYGWWSSLYSEVASKVELLEIRLEEMFSETAKRLLKSNPKIKATEIKHHIVSDHKYQKLRRRLWRWRKSERFLKHAVRGFEQRLGALQTFSANQRREKDSEPKTKYRGED